MGRSHRGCLLIECLLMVCISYLNDSALAQHLLSGSFCKFLASMHPTIVLIGATTSHGKLYTLPDRSLRRCNLILHFGSRGERKLPRLLHDVVRKSLQRLLYAPRAVFGLHFLFVACCCASSSHLTHKRLCWTVRWLSRI